MAESQRPPTIGIILNVATRWALFVVIVLAYVTPSFAQIFWSNQSPAGITDDIWCVTYGRGTFAAVTNRGNLLTSTDGLTWSRQTIDPGVWLVSIAYGDGMWVVVGDKGTVLFSSDLKAWSNANSSTTNKLNGVLWNGPAPNGTGLVPEQLLALWVAVGEAGTIITSPNAINWTLQPAIPGVTGFLHGITSNISYYPLPISEQSNNALLVCGADGVLLGAPPNGVFGGNYSSLGVITNQNLEAVLSVPNVQPAVAVGWGGTLLYGGASVSPGLSPGPPSLTLSPTATPNVVFRGLTYGNGYWVTAGELGTIFTSTDGINWTQRFSGNSPATLSTSTFLSAAYSPALQRFVIAGTGGTILISNPPASVFGNVSTRGYVSNTQGFIGGFVIEGTAPRTVLIRADGPVLSTFSVPNPLPDPVLTVYNNSGAVIATNAGWTANTNPTTISAAALEVGAFALPNSSLDSALLLTLQPGAYTAQITSAKGKTGTALFEAYTD
jgi:hypothetical protein